MSAAQNQSLYDVSASVAFDLLTTTEFPKASATEDVWSPAADVPTSIERTDIIGATQLDTVYNVPMSDLHSTPMCIQAMAPMRLDPCPLPAPAAVQYTVAVAA